MRKRLVFIVVALLAVFVAVPALADEATKLATGNTTLADPGGYASVLAQRTGQNGGDAGAGSAAAQPSRTWVYSPFIDFKTRYDAWLAMVHRTHEEEQPDWMTPIVTVTPTLQQEIRTDFSFSNTSQNLQTNLMQARALRSFPPRTPSLSSAIPLMSPRICPQIKPSTAWRIGRSSSSTACSRPPATHATTC